MAAHQAPLSLGFSRQEHWSGLPFPSPMHASEKWKWKWKWSRVQLLATPWTAAYQAPPAMGFSRQEYWSGVPLPSSVSYSRGLLIWLPFLKFFISKYYINRIIQYTAIQDWLFLLNTVLWRLIQVVACIDSSFIFLLLRNDSLYGWTSLFSPPYAGHLRDILTISRFWLFQVKCMNICVEFPGWLCFHKFYFNFYFNWLIVPTCKLHKIFPLI